MRLASVRAGNVIGGGDWAVDRIVPDCVRAWTKGSPVQLRRPEAERPWQHVLEPLSGYLTLAARLLDRRASSGESYNFGPPPGPGRSVGDLLLDLGRSFGLAPSFQTYEVLPEPPFAEASLLGLDCEKALAHLGWEPTCSFAETVQMTGEWYRRADGPPADILGLTAGQIASYEALAAKRGRGWAGSELVAGD